MTSNFDIFTKYNEKFFNFDQRTFVEKKYQENLIEELSKKNLSFFSEEKSQKNQSSFPHIIRTMTFDDNWSIKYTDNISSHSHFLYKTPVLTFHGCPGYYQDWVLLENSIGSNQFRIINCFVPGFDNSREDDRGDYSGSLDDFSLLIIRLMDHLQIKRAVFLMHSMGGYLIFNFCQKYQERVAGLVYMAAPSISWYVGFVVFYGIMVALSRMNRGIGAVSLMKFEKFRKVLTNYLRKSVEEINMEGVKFPNLNENEVCAFVKLMSSLKNISEIYSFSKKMPNVLKFLACGKNDPINEFDKFVECFFYNVYGEGGFKGVSRNVEENIKEKLKSIEEFKDLEIDYGDLQRNFVFTFEQTGHNVHRKRCRELSKPLRCYMAIIDTIEEGNWKSDAKL